MTQKFEKLVSLLRELFQLNQPDLDFGLYRVMRVRETEVTAFLREGLSRHVKEAFENYENVAKRQTQIALEQALVDAQTHFDDPEDSKEVKRLRAKLEGGIDVNALENDTYDHLYQFFRRYYAKGDFLTKRVYKEDVYAVPYQGEEVLLHWANKDQYYIKTSEYLQNYAFRLRADKVESPMRVRFQLVHASEGAHGNVMDTEEMNRVFVLVPIQGSDHKFLEEVEGEQGKELIISFEHRPATLNDWSDNQTNGSKKLPTQDDLVSLAVKRILATADPTFSDWVTFLGEPYTKVDGEKANYSRLEAHLKQYTARNTFDYFIHKNLEKFLRRELDFYVKNEVLHLDDVENENTQQVEQYLSKIKVIREIAGKIIDFLTQLEEFQKKLWLKKKFVVETNYCITLDRVPEDLYPEILSNERQCTDWVRNLSLSTNLDQDRLRSTEFFSIEFLKSHQYLMLDTRWFSENFKDKVLASLDNLDEQCDGLLVHSENFQALNLMRGKYKNAVQCIYIDPPYNAQSSEILYKNDYKHSSWLCMMADRLWLGKQFLDSYSSIVVAIDEVEQEVLGRLISDIFPGWIKACIPIEHNPRGQQGKNISFVHEFAYFVYPTDSKKCLADVKRESIDSRTLRDSGTESDRTDAKNCFYPFIVQDNKIVAVGVVPDDDFHPSEANVKCSNGTMEIWPIDDAGKEKKWRYAVSTVGQILDKLRVKKGRHSFQVIFDKDFGTMRSLWKHAKFDASEYGTKVLQDILGKERAASFSYPKSKFNVQQALTAQFNGLKEGYVLDFFSGSGTTAHAVIDMNREDGGKRKYILVEMGGYFDDVLIPRVTKAVYSDTWKSGIPCSSHTGVSQCIKYQRLESYEDALNNLLVARSSDKQALFESNRNREYDRFKETYLLCYMLNDETRGSQSLLNVLAFSDPTSYKLTVKKPGTDESHEVNVDLIESFNWLIGLNVRKVAIPQSFDAEFRRDSEQRLQLLGGLKQQEKAPYWFRTITGSLPDGREVLVIWRKLTGNLECDNLVLNEWFVEQGFTFRETEIELVYVNGSNNLENLKSDLDLWKVRLIEDDFHRLMFDVLEE